MLIRYLGRVLTARCDPSWNDRREPSALNWTAQRQLPGFRSVGARDRDIPEWRIAVIQDAPSEFAHQFMYPGGGFELGNALGRVQIVDPHGLFAGLARTCRI